MADKVTLLELHLHSEDNEFTSDVQLSSDIGELLRDRLGLGSEDAESDTGFSTDDDDDTFDTDADAGTDTGVDTDTSFESEPDAGIDPLGADGGAGTVEATDDEETGDTVVEIDEDVDDNEEESSGSALRKLLVLGLLIGLALGAQQYLGDDLEDEFAVEDDEFGVDDDENEFEEL